MRVGTLYAVLRLETGAFDAALASSESKMSRFFGLVKAGAVIAASALAVIVAGSIVAAASFQQHMTQALAIMEGVTADLRVALEDAARQVAKTTTFSANEAADAYYYLAAAGFTAVEAVKLLPVVARFAQASLIDMSEATDRLVSIMTAFGLRTGDALEQAETLAQISDALVKGATLSLGTMEELATALTTGTAQSFRIVGKSMEEALAVLMVYANQGIKGAAAGTALSIVMRELQTKAIKNADAFAQFGIAVFDSAGEMRNMADIIADFERAMAGMTDEEKKSFLIKLGLTDRSNKFLLSLIGTSEAIRDYEKQLRSAGGYTERVAAAQLASFVAQLTIMWHKIIDMGITIGNVLLPHLTEIVKKIGNWFDANNALAGQITERLVDAFRRFVLFLENRVFPVFAKIVDIIGNVADKLRIWALRIGLVGDAFGPIDRVLSAFTTGLWDILHFFESDNGTVALALGAVAFGIRLVSAALAANPVVAILLALVTAIGFLHQMWNMNVGGIQEKWAVFVEWFAQEAMPKIQDAFAWWDENIRPILEGAFKWFIDEALPVLMNAVKWLFEEGFPGLADAISGFVEENEPALRRLFTWLTEEAIPDLLELLGGIVSWLEENGPKIASSLGSMLSILADVFSVVLTVLSVVIPFIWSILEPVARVLLPLVGLAFSQLASMVSGSMMILAFVVSVAANIIQTVITFAGEVWKRVLQEIQDKIDIFTGAWDEAVGLVNGLWTELQKWAETAGNIVEGIINDISNAIYIVTSAIQGAIDLIDEFLGAKSKMDSGGSGKTKNPLPPPAPGAPPIGKTIPKGFATGVKNFAGGWAIVGERGPELVNLPSRSEVFAADQTKELMRVARFGATEHHVHLNVRGLIETKNEYDVLRQLRRAAAFMPFDMTPMMETE